MHHISPFFLWYDELDNYCWASVVSDGWIYSTCSPPMRDRLRQGVVTNWGNVQPLQNTNFQTVIKSWQFDSRVESVRSPAKKMCCKTGFPQWPHVHDGTCLIEQMNHQCVKKLLIVSEYHCSIGRLNQIPYYNENWNICTHLESV